MKSQQIIKSIDIKTSPVIAYRAFVDPNIAVKWLNSHSVIVSLCKNGPYAIGWFAADDGDFYVSFGQIKNFEKNKSLHITNLSYFYPNKKIIRELDLFIKFNKHKNETIITLKLSGKGTQKNWIKNFKDIADSWGDALFLLKKYLEKDKLKHIK